MEVNVKIRITITIDKRIYNILVGLAREESRSLSNLIQIILQKAVDQDTTVVK